MARTRNFWTDAAQRYAALNNATTKRAFLVNLGVADETQFCREIAAEQRRQRGNAHAPAATLTDSQWGDSPNKPQP